MAIGTFLLIGSAISAITSIVGAGVRRKSEKEAQEEARELAERSRKMHELANRKQFIQRAALASIVVFTKSIDTEEIEEQDKLWKTERQILVELEKLE